MDKKEAKQLGAWVSLIGGTIFMMGAVSAIYIAFFMKPETATQILVTVSRFLRNI